MAVTKRGDGPQMSLPLWNSARMPGLHLHRSNRLETLAAALSDVFRKSPAAPLQPELVVVQSLGMRRWLSLELARQLGVTMNVQFPFPAGFVQRVFSAAFPALETDRTFDRAVLPWRVLALFRDLLDQEGFEELHRYVAGEAGPLKEYQLAAKIAAVFDRYLAYRPELILGWQQGRENHWQARLWRELARGHESAHPPALAHRLTERLRRDDSTLSALPARVAIFGISSLPPFYLQLFGEISQRIEVHLFLLDPTDLYWGDLRSLKEQDRVLRWQKRRDLTPDALHLESGHTLLASLGRTGRDFSQLVLDLAPTSETERFAPPTAPTLLAQVQANIFHLQERATEARTPVAADDRSIQIHCVHSPMRELEVLHDQLLALFAADPTLAPRDILVTMPDVEAYAPFIEAVFGAPEQPEWRIPFSIADRSTRAESSLTDAFLRVLDLTGSRFGAASVLGLLETESIQRRFGLTAGDLDLLRSWIERTGIRWGIDAEHRAELGLPPFSENTWRAGLRRLLLGYALPGDDETLFAGVLPVREIEGGLAAVLGRFVEFAETLFATVRGFQDPRPLREWTDTFRETLQAFFDDNDESTDSIRALRAAFDNLAQLETASGFAAPVEFDVIRAHLGAALADSDSGSGFLAGRLTFCALKPMRSIPFKVICLLGMNDGAFPRRDAALAFDLIATQPRPGDRSLRDDDRHLFLETILSARDTLYLSYCGLSPRDNSEAPPSVLVSELLDHLRENFALPPAGLLTKHRLQPFSPEYFDGTGPLFSHSAENCRASIHSQQQRTAATPFASAPLPAPGPEWHEVSIDRLAAFFCHPARTFVRDRLGVRLPEQAELLDECEPLELDPLARLQLQSRLAQRGVGGGDLEGGLAVLRAGGQLPAGYVGDARFREMCAVVTDYVTAVRAARTGDPEPPQALDLALGEWRLTGTIHDLWPAGLIRARATDLKPADLLRAWIFHLALNCTAPRETQIFATDRIEHLRPVGDAKAILQTLLEHYGTGLCTPLPFFPKASHEFARRTLSPGKRESASPLAEARKKWSDGEFSESTDPHFALCFGHSADPLDAVWQDLALSVFKPLFDHLTSATA